MFSLIAAAGAAPVDEQWAVSAEYTEPESSSAMLGRGAQRGGAGAVSQLTSDNKFGSGLGRCLLFIIRHDQHGAKGNAQGQSQPS